MPRLGRAFILSLLPLMAMACGERTPPTAPDDAGGPPAGSIVFAIRCTAVVASANVSCEPSTSAQAAVASEAGPIDPRFLIIGGQGTNIELSSDNVGYDDVNDIFQADVTIQNLMGQPIGTPDGTTTTGLRVFFHTGPNVMVGSGDVTVANAGGTGSFTGSAQPFFEYMEMLDTNETSAPATWEWNVPGTVETFEFTVFVEADTPSTDPELELVVDGLTGAVFLTAPASDSSRLFIVRQTGVIRVIHNDVLEPTPFLDISDQVNTLGEFGLLSMAFHPDYANNGEFFVSYVDDDSLSVIERYLVTGDPEVADPNSGERLLTLHQPFANHNGGQVAFGPDGMLYISFGDAGGAGDPLENGQDSTNWFGTILRIDVDGGTPYAIPPDNPFAGHATAAEEIWAYGLRNPWRFSFDRASGDLYIADVGQADREEVDVQLAGSPGGENYGWDIMEGTQCFEPPMNCDMTGLTLPVLEYDHSGAACSITGGYVYRGSALPSLQRHYFYGDFCAGWIRSFRLESGMPVDQRDYTPELGTISQLTSFGEDAAGELYITSHNGSVYRIVPGS